MTEPDIRMLEELAFAAWPALATVIDDGWVLRLAEGHTKRANSANVLWSARDPLPEKVARVEALYGRHGFPSVFRLTPLAPPALESLLAAYGYRCIDETIVMRAPVGAHVPDPRIAIMPAMRSEWVAAYAAFEKLSPQRTATLQRMMHSIAPLHATAAVVDDGRIVGFGLGVLDRGYIGAFEILVAPSHRRQGLARGIMQSLLAWGRSAGANHAYLQVVAANTPAIALYRELGYAEVYRYWYRSKQ